MSAADLDAEDAARETDRGPTTCSCCGATLINEDCPNFGNGAEHAVVIYDWIDFEPEPDVTGDGSGDPEKYILTIREHGEELAVIVHRVCGGRFPLDGEVAERKRRSAQRIVQAMGLAS